ncbi:MAG: hypothetical protein JSV93_00875 [Candidatus Omnitrophota bacterium]|nr:MAG: hypothetical protein JSV93_00875 [Candidatus Omnitrophota bacterium]
MLNELRKYLNENKNLINIFLVYFFLTFAIGYIDFDRRVKSFEQATENLRKVAEGGAYLPMARRILIPYTLYFMHKTFRIPLAHIYAFFRFLFFFLAFCLFHIYLKKWFDDKLAMIGTLSVIASLPLTLTNWYSIPTDIPELITFILGAMWIRDNRYKLLFLLIPLATLNKETTIALVLIYFLYGIGRERPLVLIKRTAIYSLLWAIPYISLIYIFGYKYGDYSKFCTLQHNWTGLAQMFKTPNPYNHYYFLIYLCGFYWILAFRNFRRKDIFLKRSMPVVILFFLYVFFWQAAINEVRVFISFYVFVIPLGLFSLFKEKKT